MFPMIGQISLFAFNFAPQNWMKCNGALIPISENDTLFQLLGFKFGGDNANTFALPNLTAPPNLHYSMALGGQYQPRKYDGYIGETMLTAFKPEATNLLPATGQSLPKRNYMVLDMYMGTRFGGDGQNLALPNLQSQAPRDCQYVIAVFGDIPDQLSPAARKPYVGEIRFLPYQQPNESLAICDGAQLSVDQHPVLHALIGKTFGGGGKTFALPDLTKVAPKGYSYYIVMQGVLRLEVKKSG